MKKLLKALLLFVIALLLGGILVVAGAWFMIRHTPAWYRLDASTIEQRQAAARNAENMLTELTNWAGIAHARHVRAAAVPPSTAPRPKVLDHEPSESFQIQFTDQELNAFFNKWADFRGRREFFDQFVEDPRLVLHNNQVILAGTVKDMNMVVSMQFEPRIDEQGRLQPNLVHILGGILPLPDVMWKNQSQKVQRILRSKLPEYQRSASIANDGTANSAAASAAMNKLLLALLSHEPVDPVFFIPYDLRNLGRTVPVKISALSIQNNTLTVTAEQMTEQERQALLDRLRTPFDGPTAMTR